MTQEANLIGQHFASHPASLVVNTAASPAPLVPVVMGGAGALAPAAVGLGLRRRRRCESISGRDQGFGGGSSAVAESCSWGQEGQVQEEKGQPRFSQTSQALQGSQEEEEKVKEVQEVQKAIKLNLFELLNQSFQEPFFEHQFQEPEALGLEGIGEGQGLDPDLS